MRPSVMTAFRPFNTAFEADLRFMYKDALGLVTTGMGNKVDPIAYALPLPWVHPDGSPASVDEISEAWHKVKDNRTSSSFADGALTTIRLTDQGVDNLILEKIHQIEDVVHGRYPAYETWPADAQQGLLSMAWAQGASFRFPKFDAHCNELDFDGASAECRMQGVGIDKRNEANFLLFRNAARVVRNKLDPSKLWYPSSPPDAPAKSTSWPWVAVLLIGGGLATYYLIGGSRT